MHQCLRCWRHAWHIHRGVCFAQGEVEAYHAQKHIPFCRIWLWEWLWVKRGRCLWLTTPKWREIDYLVQVCLEKGHGLLPQSWNTSKDHMTQLMISTHFLRHFMTFGPRTLGSRRVGERAVWVGRHIFSKHWMLGERSPVRRLTRHAQTCD